ncbi:MAG: PadR family transcriptional regulator [Steroidobacter sp.]
MPRIPNTSPQTLRLLDVLLASRHSWRHGYDLARETELKSGTLYPLLMRLADQGFLESRWETDGDNRRPRHVYRLTAIGATYAKGLTGKKSVRLRPRRLVSI